MSWVFYYFIIIASSRAWEVLLILLLVKVRSRWFWRVIFLSYHFNIIVSRSFSWSVLSISWYRTHSFWTQSFGILISSSFLFLFIKSPVLLNLLLDILKSLSFNQVFIFVLRQILLRFLPLIRFLKLMTYHFLIRQFNWLNRVIIHLLHHFSINGELLHHFLFLLLNAHVLIVSPLV